MAEQVSARAGALVQYPASTYMVAHNCSSKQPNTSSGTTHACGTDIHAGKAVIYSKKFKGEGKEQTCTYRREMRKKWICQRAGSRLPLQVAMD